MNNFNKILEIMRKTGDKFIIVENGEPMYVIAPFAEYDRMVNTGMSLPKPAAQAPAPVMPAYQPLTVSTANTPAPAAKLSDEEKLLEKVNQDIAEFRSKQDTGKAVNKDEQYYIEPVEQQ